MIRRMQQIVVLAVLWGAIIGTAAAPAPIKIYFDSTRRNGGKFVWQPARGAGEMCATRFSSLADYDVLKRYDLMVIYNATEECRYLPVELDSIGQFVREGGGLLLIADPRKGETRKPRRSRVVEAPPDDSFSANQVARLFGVDFLGQFKKQIVPEFEMRHPANKGVVAAPQQFKQVVGVLSATRDGAETVVKSPQGPAALAGEYGKGRFIIAALPDLFDRYNEPKDKLKTESNLQRQLPLFRQWAEWLAAASPQRNTEWKDCPSQVLPRDCISNDWIDVFFVPQLKLDAERIITQWASLWPNLSAFLGLKHPLEIRGHQEAGERLQVLLTPTSGVGHSGAWGVVISVWSDKPGQGVGLLGHEMGHKILGGCNAALSEGFANWVGLRTVSAAGYADGASALKEKFMGNFRKADPNGNALDIGLPTAAGPAANGKWIWILDELTRKHGDGLTRAYLAALRTQVDLCRPNSKLIDGKKVRLSMEDHVAALNKATDSDLRPWFRSLGITVSSVSAPAEAATATEDDEEELEP